MIERFYRLAPRAIKKDLCERQRYTCLLRIAGLDPTTHCGANLRSFIVHDPAETFEQLGEPFRL